MSPMQMKSVDFLEFFPTAAKQTAPNKKGTPVGLSSGSGGHCRFAGSPPNCAKQPFTAAVECQAIEVPGRDHLQEASGTMGRPIWPDDDV
eukprot:CAMPEP_0115696114 /NCGR_PEP_ID=MMETSP0272-20121206/65113_1 /TAXON_ID=71861 /ORGANISM="Scrippsiella trochoidea, Strain CCMP3099" /LENGTH=89 /DNA_ID=CAMNT_0003136331 /DNA_START=202 /DNA_END=467 /DNA_ORIENTATION=+